MLIDLHLHTSRYSSCGKATPQEMLAGATAAGLDAVVITEHHTIWPLSELQLLRASFPRIRIFRGMEVTCDRGRADILVLGVSDPDVAVMGMRPDEIINRVHRAGGVAILAHPFRMRSSIPAELLATPPDAYEVMSLNMPAYARHQAPLLARLWPEAHQVACSDAHQVAGLGAYAILLDRPVANESELAAAVREGAFRLVVDEQKLRQRHPHWRAQQERVEALMAAGLSYQQIRRETGLSRALVRYVMAGGDLVGDA